MKFYFKAHYTTAIRRVGLFKKLMIPELISLDIVSDNGDHFYALNIDASMRYAKGKEKYIETLPSILDIAWIPLKEIKKKLIDYLYDVDKESGPFVFVHSNDETACTLLSGLFDHEEGFVKFHNLQQEIDSYVDNLTNDDFGLASDYRLEKLTRYNEPYNFEDKMDMFVTHTDYPYKPMLGGDAIWVRAMSNFMKGLKQNVNQ